MGVPSQVSSPKRNTSLCADTGGLPPELTRILATIKDLDERSAGKSDQIHAWKDVAKIISDRHP